MDLSLSELASQVRNYPGLLRKNPIEDVFESLLLHGQPGPHLPNYGDDAAVIPWKDGFLLLAADGIMTRLLIQEPYAAGKSAVMVTVNDIYSMGGRPLAMVNVLASGNEEHRRQVVAGIKRGCEKLKVPMVGGHLHPDAPPETPSLSVAILGWAQKPLRSHLAEAEDDLIFATDLKGQIGCHSVVSWDANSGKSPEELLYRLDALTLIAEREWAHAAKDVSNAGLLGTLCIMMENSGKGAEIDVPSIPCPPELDLQTWILSFQSFGFLLSVPRSLSQVVIDLFKTRDIDAVVVGRVTEDPRVVLKASARKATLFDFKREKITGISYPQST